MSGMGEHKPIVAAAAAAVEVETGGDGVPFPRQEGITPLWDKALHQETYRADCQDPSEGIDPRYVCGIFHDTIIVDPVVVALDFKGAQISSRPYGRVAIQNHIVAKLAAGLTPKDPHNIDAVIVQPHNPIILEHAELAREVRNWREQRRREAKKVYNENRAKAKEILIKAIATLKESVASAPAAAAAEAKRGDDFPQKALLAFRENELVIIVNEEAEEAAEERRVKLEAERKAREDHEQALRVADRKAEALGRAAGNGPEGAAAIPPPPPPIPAEDMAAAEAVVPPEADDVFVVNIQDHPAGNLAEPLLGDNAPRRRIVPYKKIMCGLLPLTAGSTGIAILIAWLNKRDDDIPSPTPVLSWSFRAIPGSIPPFGGEFSIYNQGAFPVEITRIQFKTNAGIVAITAPFNMSFSKEGAGAVYLYTFVAPSPHSIIIPAKINQAYNFSFAYNVSREDTLGPLSEVAFGPGAVFVTANGKKVEVPIDGLDERIFRSQIIAQVNPPDFYTVRGAGLEHIFATNSTINTVQYPLDFDSNTGDLRLVDSVADANLLPNLIAYAQRRPDFNLQFVIGGDGKGRELASLLFGYYSQDSFANQFNQLLSKLSQVGLKKTPSLVIDWRWGDGLQIFGMLLTSFGVAMVNIKFPQRKLKWEAV